MPSRKITIGWTEWLPAQKRLKVDGLEQRPDRLASTYRGPNDSRRTTEPSWEAEWDLPNGLCVTLLASQDRRGYWEITMLLWASPDYENDDNIVVIEGNRAIVRNDAYGSTVTAGPEDGAEFEAILKSWGELEVIRDL